MTSPMILIARPGAGERMAPDHALRQPQLLADAPHLVLEQQAERLDQLHLHVGGEPTDVVVRLDLRRDPDVTAGLDHVGVERPLHEEAHVPERAGLLLEHADELLADDLPLLLGLGDALEPPQEPLACVDVDERARGSARRTSRPPARPRSRGGGRGRRTRRSADRRPPCTRAARRRRSRRRRRGRRSRAPIRPGPGSRSTCSSITAAGVHAGGAPATS